MFLVHPWMESFHSQACSSLPSNHLLSGILKVLSCTSQYFWTICHVSSSLCVLDMFLWPSSWSCQLQRVLARKTLSLVLLSGGQRDSGRTNFVARWPSSSCMLLLECEGVLSSSVTTGKYTEPASDNLWKNLVNRNYVGVQWYGSDQLDIASMASASDIIIKMVISLCVPFYKLCSLPEKFQLK